MNRDIRMRKDVLKVIKNFSNDISRVNLISLHSKALLSGTEHLKSGAIVIQSSGEVSIRGFFTMFSRATAFTSPV